MADGDLNDSERLAMLGALRELRALASPMFPLTSRAIRRCVHEAEKLGLVCVPAIFNVAVPAPVGTLATTFSVTVPKSAGPLAIVDMNLPEDHPDAHVNIRVNNSGFQDGFFVAGDVFDIPRRYNGTLMESPIPIFSNQTMDVYMTDSSAFTAAQGATFYGLGVRAKLQQAKRVCEAPPDLAMQWLTNVAARGIFWCTTVVTDGPGTKQGPIAVDCIAETLVLAEKRAVVEGEGNSINTQLRNGPPLFVTQTQGPLFGRRDDNDRVLVQSGLRFPIGEGTILELEVLYDPTTATRIPVRASYIGRRGGTVSNCWKP